MASDSMNAVGAGAIKGPPNLDAVLARMDALNSQVAYLVERQRKQEELLSEFAPILKEVMATATQRLDALEKQGLFELGRELGYVGQRVFERFNADDVRQLGDAVVGILETVRAMTQPPVLKVMGEASQVLAAAEQTEPLGLVGMVRATRDAEVQRGMAVLMALLRKVGQGAGALTAKEQKPSPVSAKAHAGLLARTAPRRRQVVASPPASASRPAQELHAPRGCAVPKATANANAKPPAPAVVLDGVGFTADGHLADPSQWSRSLAETLAAAQGVALSETHWKVVEFARSDFEKTKASPNVRRITQALGMATKELYALFPKAPARTVAKLAGIPKPAGCL